MQPWFGLSEARSVQERLRVIFSQFGPELVRVDKKFITWLFLTFNYLKSEPWRIGVNETVYRKELKTQQFSFTPKDLYRTRKSENVQRNCLFSSSFKSFKHFESGELKHFLYSRLSSRALTSFIMPRVLANHSARYTFTSSSHIIMYSTIFTSPSANNCQI